MQVMNTRPKSQIPIGIKLNVKIDFLNPFHPGIIIFSLGRASFHYGDKPVLCPEFAMGVSRTDSRLR
jgi:hypothetical protein